MKKYKCLSQSEYFFNKLTLNFISKEDIEKIREWRNNQKNILRQNKDIQKKQQLKYFENNVWPERLTKNPAQILFTIKHENLSIGYGGFTNISWENKRAEISFLLDTKIIDNKILYKKIFSNFLKIIKNIAFIELKFNKVFTETYASRHHHISILKMNKFELEGRLKKHTIKDNKYEDSLIHSILKK
tara:strand:- start:447 stop:1007 length:561 start_codon:yes stop_codon:yes gene_type:complete